MNENNEQNGGLFSDEHLTDEAPKRENPYLKKNRDKAKAERAAEAERKKRENRTAEDPGASAVATEDKPTYSAPTPPPIPEDEGYTHRRTFSDWMFEHVKLIATIATALAILALVLITDVVDIVGDLVMGIQQADSEEITLTYVKGLSEKSDPVQWSDFDRFRHEISKADDSVTWKLTVEGTRYEVWVTGVDTDSFPTEVWLIDWNSGDRMTLGVDDLDTFLAEHTKK